MFTGFTKQAGDFMWELAFNNERPWFMEHKAQFEALVNTPMKALAADGMTMIVVTHEMRFAREVAARTIFLADGKIEEDKPSHELFDNPESPRLVTFLQKVL